MQQRLRVSAIVAKSRTGFYFVERCAQQKTCVASCRGTLAMQSLWAIIFYLHDFHFLQGSVEPYAAFHKVQEYRTDDPSPSLGDKIITHNSR